MVGYVRELICKLGRDCQTQLFYTPNGLPCGCFVIYACFRACCLAILIALNTLSCLLASDRYMAANKHDTIRGILLQLPELAVMPYCPQSHGSFTRPHRREDQSPHCTPSEKGVARPSPVSNWRGMLVVSISRKEASCVD